MNIRTLTDIDLERDNQNDKWGGPDNDDTHTGFHWVAIFSTHLGKLAHSLWHGDVKRYRQQLVRIAAIAVAAIEACDRTATPED
jgi:hypothetical protein